MNSVMKTQEKVAIGMDYSVASVIKFTPESYEMKNVESQFPSYEKMDKSEQQMHNKKNKLLSDYYKNLVGLIKNYSEILLFGPNSAKVELLNVLRHEKDFKKMKVEIKNTDKMTENQKIFFVKEYFSKE